MESANHLSKEKEVQSLNQLQELSKEPDSYFHKTGNNTAKDAFPCYKTSFETVLMLLSSKESKWMVHKNPYVCLSKLTMKDFKYLCLS